MSTWYQVLQKTRSDLRILSSKVARNDPGYAPSLTTRFIVPRMPETVLSYAPVNFAASRFELNMPLMKAVFL